MIEHLVAGGARAAARKAMADRRAREQALLASGWSCPHCAARRVPRTRYPGSDLKNLMLFAFLFFPGVYYWNWRDANRWHECAACGERLDLPAWYTGTAATPGAAQPAARAMTTTGAGFQCPRCSSTHAPTVRRRGSTALHVLLYCCWVIPGVLYGMWRKARRGQLVCDRCGLELGPEPA